MRFTFVGHLSVDINVVGGQPHTLYGGGVVHGAITATRLGAEATVLTRCGPAQRPGFSVLADAGVTVRYLAGQRCTSIRNVYPSDSADERITTLLTRAEPFALADLEALTDRVVHVNPLTVGELPPELLLAARERVDYLGADAQGFLRHVQPDGATAYADWVGKERFLPSLDLLKVDVREATILTGFDEPVRAARRLVALGPATVLLTHEHGLIACTSSDLAQARFGPYRLEGRTGRGDTCTAAFVVSRLKEGASLQAAAERAALVTTRKMQYPGPYAGD